MKKKLALLMATLMVGSTFMATGCFGDDSAEDIDPTKTQLYIANQDVGIGRTWVDTLSKKFEEAFKNHSFEDGKKGVQIIPDHDTRFTGAYAEKCNSDANYIYFSESVNYAGHNKYMEVITDIMQEGAITGSDGNGGYTRESTAIVDKIDPIFAEYLNVGTEAEPEYHAMPYYLGMRVVNYDMDLWSAKRFYFAKTGAPSEIIVKALEEGTDLEAAKASYDAEIAKIEKGTATRYWTFADGEGNVKNGDKDVKIGLSAGPDGKYDTFDDGLPATYEEFYLLCDKMVNASVTPFIWTGASPNYAENLTRSLFQNDAGVDTLKTYYSLEGEVDTLVKLDKNGKVVYEADGKTPKLESFEFKAGEEGESGYNIFRLESLYNALQFAEKVISKREWTDAACFDQTSMVAAQAKYLTQGNTSTGNRIAMILDGSWWQQEATSTFEIMEKVNKKYSKQNRNFSVMSLPNATVDRYVRRIENDEKMTFVPANDSLMYINGKLEEGSPELEVTKAFLSFISSDDSILSFMEDTNMLRPLTPDYAAVKESDPDRIKNLSAYSKRLIDLQENANVVYPYSEKIFPQENSSIWNFFESFPNNKIGQMTYAIQSLKNADLKSKGLTGAVYFEGVYAYAKDFEWTRLN